MSSSTWELDWVRYQNSENTYRAAGRRTTNCNYYRISTSVCSYPHGTEEEHFKKPGQCLKCVVGRIITEKLLLGTVSVDAGTRKDKDYWREAKCLKKGTISFGPAR